MGQTPPKTCALGIERPEYTVGDGFFGGIDYDRFWSVLVGFGEFL